MSSEYSQSDEPQPQPQSGLDENRDQHTDQADPMSFQMVLNAVEYMKISETFPEDEDGIVTIGDRSPERPSDELNESGNQSNLDESFNSAFDEDVDILIRKCTMCNVANIIANASDIFECYSCVYELTRKQHFKRTESVACSMCDNKIFRLLLGEHMMRVHGVEYDQTIVDSDDSDEPKSTNVQLFYCGHCMAIGITKSNLNEHHLVNHADIPFDSGNFHLIAEEDKFDSRCEMCNKAVPESRMDRHEKFECGKKEAIAIIEISKITQNPNKIVTNYRCETCKKGVTGVNLEKHNAGKHNDDQFQQNRYTQIGQDFFEECQLCDRYFKVNTFVQHLEEFHSNTLIRDTLDQFIKQQKAASGVIQKSLKQMVKCDECGIEVRKDNLDRHMEITHPKSANIRELWPSLFQEQQFDNNGQELKPLIETGYSPIVSQKFGPFVRAMFKCGACSTNGFLKRHFQNHLSKKHKKDTSLDENTFEPYTVIEMIKCMCGKEMVEKNFKKHMNEHLTGIEFYYIYGERINSGNNEHKEEEDATE